ncbi:MAG: hypothetical protein HUJ26_16810 [Planctomycetaceae bacterium]|nr:hypothetical protein [Planctomycetaceae bacterium]
MKYLLPIVLLFTQGIGCRPMSETEPHIETAESTDSETDEVDHWWERLDAESSADIASLEHDRTSIDLSGTDITDDDLRELRHFDQLESLNLSSTRVTNGAAEHILALHSLRELDLVFTQMTGAGIQKLGAHPSLTNIELWYDTIDEEGLQGLQNLQALMEVILWVPDFGDEDELLPPKIKKIRPDVEVEVMWYVAPIEEITEE